MRHELPRQTLVVRILDGPFKGFTGPVVGIDQPKGIVRVRIARHGVVLGPKHTTVEIEVRRVRRLRV